MRGFCYSTIFGAISAREQVCALEHGIDNSASGAGALARGAGAARTWQALSARVWGDGRCAACVRRVWKRDYGVGSSRLSCVARVRWAHYGTRRGSDKLQVTLIRPAGSPKTAAQKAVLESAADMLFFGGAAGSLKTETMLVDAARESNHILLKRNDSILLRCYRFNAYSRATKSRRWDCFEGAHLQVRRL